MPLAICIWCEEPLQLRDGMFVHGAGGLYMLRCGVCAWRGAPARTPASCPRCGATGVRDDHCALPKVTMEVVS